MSLTFSNNPLLAASDCSPDRSWSCRSKSFCCLFRLGRGNHGDGDKLVALPSAAQADDTAPFQAEDGPRLGAFRDLQLLISLQSRNADFRAEGGLGEADRQSRSRCRCPGA